MKKPISNLRWYIVGLLCLASELNYMDRQVLSVLAETIQRELNLSTVDYSYITSSFLVSYTIMYAVSGRLVDTIGTRSAFAIFVTSWSITNALHALAYTALQFSFFRFLLGVTEAANFPAGVKAVSEWFPMKDRALATGIFNAGASIGAALAAPVASFIALTWGWRYAFVVTGLLGFVWVVAWLILYHSPKTHPRLSELERSLILSDVTPSNRVESKIPLRTILSLRETWGCILVRVVTDPITYFLIFWVPKYLQQEQGFNLADLGKYGWIPYVALALGSICGGGVVSLLIANGYSVNKARKSTMLVVSCLVPVGYFLLTQVDSPVLALVIIAMLMFGHNAWGNITIPAEIFDPRMVGTVTGLGGAFGGLAGIITQLTIGWVVQNLSYGPIFVACSISYLLALLIVQYWIGPLGTIREIGNLANGRH
jgi:MFS transporter, ACS family, hexuronate transporter